MQNQPHTGSLAASLQASTSGGIVAGSWLATAQSAAMGGYGVVAVNSAVTAGAATIMGALGGVLGYSYAYGHGNGMQIAGADAAPALPSARL